MKQAINLVVMEFVKYTWIYFSIAVILYITGMTIIDKIFYVPIQPLRFTWNGILMFLGISAGIGWMFHGTGFLLVRVSK